MALASGVSTNPPNDHFPCDSEARKIAEWQVALASGVCCIGAIGALGEWVLRSACETAAGWRRQGLAIPVWVNLSARQIHGGLPGVVRRCLAATGLTAQDLVLEITESVLMRDETTVLPVLNEIREIRNGGGSGSIIGRNSFQRPKEEAKQLLDTIINIYKSKA